MITLDTDHMMTRPSVDVETRLSACSKPPDEAAQCSAHTGSLWEPPPAVHWAVGWLLRARMLYRATVPSNSPTAKQCGSLCEKATAVTPAPHACQPKPTGLSWDIYLAAIRKSI